MSDAVVFDVDGVLVDSYRAHLESWRRLAGEHGFELTEARFRESFGRTSRDIIRRFWSGDDLSEERLRKLDDRKEALYREIVDHDFPAMDGAAALVNALHRERVLVGVGSSGPPENVALALERLGVEARVQAVVTGTDVTRGKPDPQVFLLVAQRLRIAPERCVVVEDAPDGIRAAKRAGMGAVALASTGRSESDFDGTSPDLLVRSLRELTPARLVSLKP